MEPVLWLVGPGVLVGVVAGGSAYLLVRRVGPAVAVVLAPTGTWLAFAFQWIVWSISENADYNRDSAYGHYRDEVIEGWNGIWIGVGYAALAGAVAVGAGALARKRLWGPLAVAATFVAVALPLIVPAALSHDAPVLAQLPADTTATQPAQAPEQPPERQLPPPRVLPSDADVQAALLRAGRHMRHCKRAYGTYVACTGEPHVRSIVINSFVAVAKSADGPLYGLIVHGDRERRRCTPPDLGLCPRTGLW